MTETDKPVRLPPGHKDKKARAAILAIATALAGLSGLPSDEQARVDAALAAARELEE